MAAKVAIAATIVRGMILLQISGTVRKSSKPVNLLAMVCGKQNRLMLVQADI